MATPSYPEFFATWQESLPFLTTVQEGQTPEAANSEQQVFLLWLFRKLLEAGELFPKSSFYCRTADAGASLDALASEVTSRIRHLQNSIFIIPGAYDVYLHQYLQTYPDVAAQMQKPEFRLFFEQGLYFYWVNSQLDAILGLLPQTSFYCKTQNARDALSALRSTISNRINTLMP